MMSHKNLKRLNSSVTQRFPYISKKFLPDVLTKMALSMQKQFPLFVTHKADVKKLTEIMCQIGTVALDSRVMNCCTIARGIVLMLREVDSKYNLPQASCIEDFLCKVYDSLKNGKLEFSDEEWNGLFLLSVSAVELEVISLLKSCSETPDANLFFIKSCISNSKLIYACGSSPFVFHKVLSLLVYAWQLSEGSQLLHILLTELFAAVEAHTCLPVISLFPENMQHLVILFSIAPPVFCSIGSAPCVWPVVLDTLQSGLCRKTDLIALLGVFPLWYQQLLEHVVNQNNATAFHVFKILCPYTSKDEVQVLMGKLKSFSSFSSQSYTKSPCENRSFKTASLNS